MTQSLTILGSTGSIGGSTLDVVARHPERFRIFALSGHSQTAEGFAAVPEAEEPADYETQVNQEPWA